MLPNLCPRCGEPSLVLIGDGVYRCKSCGYVGKSTFNEGIFKS